MLPSLLLLTQLVAASTAEPPDLRPSHAAPESRSGEAPTVVVHRQPASEVTTVRLTLLASDPDGYAGAGLYLQYLVLPRLRERMAQVGGVAEIERTDDGLTYALTGPSAELGVMTAALRDALSPPSAGQTARLQALRRMESDRLAVWESAPAHVRARLRASLFPEAGMASGTDRSPERLLSVDPRELWRMMYRPERLLIVAAGDVDPATLRAEFGDLSAEAVDPPAAEPDPVTPLAAPQSTRLWLGAAYRLDRVEPAVLTVLSRLIQFDIQSRLPQGEVSVEHWWSRHGQAIAVVVAVPERQADEARELMQGAPSRIAVTVASDPDVLRDAARTLWRQMLLEGRSPDRMAMILSQFIARTGNAHEANRYHHALTSVRARNLEDAAEALAAAPTARFVLPPQPLERD